MAIDRRQALLRSLFGATGVGLRALATGLPLPYLLRPGRLAAAASQGVSEVDAGRVQRLVLATSSAGDPLNANVPGTYDDPRVVHGRHPALAAAKIWQRGVARTGAACWRELSQPLLDRTAFFHHATHTVVHAQRADTLALGGAVAQGEQFASWAASKLAGPLQTLQPQPICVGVSDAAACLRFAGKVQAQLQPTALAAALRPCLSEGGSVAHALPGLRADTLARLRAWHKNHSSHHSARKLQPVANTEAEQRHKIQRLQQLCASIVDDGTDGQLAAVALLFALNVAPVVQFHLDWGGDNHNDADLLQEARAHVRAVATLQRLYARLADVGLADEVTLLGLNGFGRTLAAHHKQGAGRDHNGNHHVALIVGRHVAGGVVGGIAPMARDYGATALDSRSGAAAFDGGDVAFSETLASMGKTVGRSLGLTDACVQAGIRGGKVVESTRS